MERNVITAGAGELFWEWVIHMKKSIRITHRLRNSDYPIAEYFVPYKPDVLQKIVKSKLVSEKLDIVASRYGSFEEYAKSKSIEALDLNLESVEDEGAWINDEYNLSENNMWDYLADVTLINDTVMQDNSDSVEALNMEALQTFASRIKYDYRRIAISIMIYTERYVHEDYVDFSENKKTILTDIYRLIDRASKCKVHDIGEIDDIHEKFLTSYNKFTATSWNENLEFVLERADSIMKSMVSDIGQEEKIGYYTKTLNIIKKEILKSSGEKVTLKKRYIRFISNIAHAFNIETHDMPKDDSAIFEACIWKDKLTEIYRHFFISLSQINTNDELVSTRSNNFESMTKQFTEEIAKIKSALKLKKDFNLVNKYSGKKQGCYTIFVLPNGEKYWALSGTDSWDRNKRLQMEMLVKYIFDNTFGWHHVTNIYTKNHGIRYCPIRKKTMRYTEVIEPDSNSKIKYVSKKEKLGDDLKTRRIDKRKDDYLRKIGLTYGCCERKIMSYLSDFNGITIYSRWAPCEKCMPAIFELGKYTYYAYAKNYMEWINGGKPMKLEKYTVEKSYLVSIE